MASLHRLARYAQVFFIALGHTLRGTKPASMVAQEQREAKAAPLLAWCRQTVLLTDAVATTADAHGLDRPARQALILRIEGRNVSLETAIMAVRFHAAQEFPDMLRDGDSYARLAIQATTLNDQHLLRRFADSEVLHEGVKTALGTLSAHLESPPLS